jgi:hypothetical protein
LRGWGGVGGGGVVGKGMGEAGGEMTQALYAHTNNNKKKELKLPQERQQRNETHVCLTCTRP